MALREKSENPVLSADIVNVDNKSARHKLISRAIIHAQVKSEYPPNAPLFSVSDSVQVWIDKAHIGHFIFILPRKWDLMLRADRATPYLFMECICFQKT